MQNCRQESFCSRLCASHGTGIILRSLLTEKNALKRENKLKQAGVVAEKQVCRWYVDD